MAYYLMSKKGKEYLPINISSLSDFERMSKFKDGYSLEEIDKFTSKYNSDKELRLDLYSNGLLDIDDINRDISIRRKTKGIYQKVTYGLVYSDVIKYFNEDYLLYTILSKQKDIEFLRRLTSYYRNSYINNDNISQIRDYVNYQNMYINVYNVLRDFYMKEIYEFDKKTGEMKLKYKSLHDLAMFVYNYDNVVVDEIIDINELKEKENKSYVKKKIKIKKEVEGQLSFDDIL